jgi:hypothetical protein
MRSWTLRARKVTAHERSGGLILAALVIRGHLTDPKRGSRHLAAAVDQGVTYVPRHGQPCRPV